MEQWGLKALFSRQEADSSGFPESTGPWVQGASLWRNLKMWPGAGIPADGCGSVEREAPGLGWERRVWQGNLRTAGP